jgi:hypothetical protein
MERLCEKEQTELKKCSTEKLIQKLAGAGYDVEVIKAWDRPLLLHSAAILQLSGTSPGVKGAAKPEVDWELRWKLEEEARDKDRAAAEARWRAELEAKERERLAELAAREQDRVQADLRLKEELAVKDKELELRVKLEIEARDKDRRAEMEAKDKDRRAEMEAREQDRRMEEARWRAEMELKQKR